MPGGAGFVFFVVTANGATLAKAKIQQMPGSKGESRTSGKKIMSYLNRPSMGMIVAMPMGIRAKKNEGQSQSESQENPKLTMLQVTAKQSGTGNQKGSGNHRFLETFRPKE